MAREKTTTMIDRTKLNEVRALTGATSVAGAIDLALSELLRRERLRADVAAYSGARPTDEEIALAQPATDWSDLADDTDWDALFGP